MPDRSLLEGVGSVGLEDSSKSFMAGSWHASQNWELKLAVSKDSWVGSSDVFLFVQNWSSDDWNGVLWGSVVTGHILVKLAHSSVQRYISVFLVHVGHTGSGLIPQDNSIGLYVVWSFLEDLINRQNLALGALNFSLSSEMIPALLIDVTRICFERWLYSERRFW